MKKDDDNRQQQQIHRELSAIDSLLRNKEFAFAIAKAEHNAYYANIGATPPPFLESGDDTAKVIITRKDEKIAINLAGFYALECGLGALCAQSDQKPTDMLQAIINNKVDSATFLLLNRFANATWKAGQPFQGLDRIERSVFTMASFLPKDEVQKDYDQIQAAAEKLQIAMQDVRNGSLNDQMSKLRSLLQSESFAAEIASHLDASYYKGQQKPVHPFLSPEDETATVTKSVKEQKIATNLAGFYALTCGLDYLATTQQKLPSDILESINNNTIGQKDKQLLNRFANATWRAVQPFRGLNRITCNTFAPFYFLTEADIEKDWVQVKAVAVEVRRRL
ncbi:hypothetical protein HNV11_16360 [Spirosoma taeanense]|uniref:Uncharacterized protein n=1 Tax=Spirosoma taeanense TaxID=2735870 RepID=A0A6M5Y994_9BACT|nr:hypothetical protein [Spirosoma taeanense]QJW90837.1 hypothetical protein HNV11_16360 [Spirosoma taeanense]